MSGWNYRIILHDTDDDVSKHWYGLHECYYDIGGSKGISWTERAIDFVCDRDEGKEGIIKALEMALADARAKPVLIESEHPPC